MSQQAPSCSYTIIVMVEVSRVQAVWPFSASAASSVLQELGEVKEASEAADKAAVADGKTLPPHDISGIPEDVSELSVAQLQVWPPTPEPACFDKALPWLTQGLVDPQEQRVNCTAAVVGLLGFAHLACNLFMSLS
jgi:hypothetical protein